MNKHSKGFCTDIRDQNPLFPYTKKDKKLILKELNLEEKVLNEGVQSITDWFGKQPHLSDAGFDQHFIEKLIIVSKGSVEKAKQRLDNFYKYRGLSPEFIQEREVLQDPERKLWEVCSIFPIAKLKDGLRVHFIKFAEDLGMFDLTDLFRMGFMYADIRLRYDYWLGDIWVLDFKNISLTHIFTLRPAILQKAAFLFQNGLNWRIQSIHVINVNNSAFLAQRAMDFLNQFFSSVLISRVIIYDNPEDLLKHIPLEFLPEDYGGRAPNSAILIDNVETEFKRQETIDFLLNCRTFKSDETKRPRDDNCEDNEPGTFKKSDSDSNLS
ncbi:unnamed protein product [Chrysodeixis includens]|uniref:CRAL-TRIO domain-containing protein n=1 Tax=Chrysodeixis includens TaxID=689277 RepID=A0A9P0FTM6_CHRIL|nr:unnamed protein product [Chrysodeixis includens]